MPHLQGDPASSSGWPADSWFAALTLSEWKVSMCVKHSDVFRYFKNKYCHALCDPSLSSFPRIKKKIPVSHNNIAENLKWFISWLIYFVITDLLVNSRVIFFAFCLFMLFMQWIFSLCYDSCSWKMLPMCINSNEIICASHVHTHDVYV